MERFNSHHWLVDPLDKMVVLLKVVVEISDPPDFYYGSCSCEYQDRVDGLQSTRLAQLLSMATFSGIQMLQWFP